MQQANERGGPRRIPKTPLERFYERKAYEHMFLGYYLAGREQGLKVIEIIGQFRRMTQVPISDVRLYAIAEEASMECRMMKKEG